MKVLLRSLKKEEKKIMFDIIVIYEKGDWNEGKKIATYSYTTNKEGRGLFARDDMYKTVIRTCDFYLSGNIEAIRKKIKRYIEHYIKYYTYI